ncbi:uncharacterized protein F5891DRAFT_1010003, partial [Suillus fuscotomentosus]
MQFSYYVIFIVAPLTRQFPTPPALSTFPVFLPVGCELGFDVVEFDLACLHHGSSSLCRNHFQRRLFSVYPSFILPLLLGLSVSHGRTYFSTHDLGRERHVCCRQNPPPLS